MILHGPVLKPWSTFPMQCPAQWPCLPQLGPTAFPLQSNCFTASGLVTRSSGLTSFMGKYFSFFHGKNCHLAQASQLHHTSVRIISLKTCFLGQQGENTVLFLLFFSPKILNPIYVNSQKQDRTMDSTWAQRLPINDTYSGQTRWHGRQKCSDKTINKQ